MLLRFCVRPRIGLLGFAALVWKLSPDTATSGPSQNFIVLAFVVQALSALENFISELGHKKVILQTDPESATNGRGSL